METKKKVAGLAGLSLRTKIAAGIGALVVAGGGIAAATIGLGSMGGGVVAPAVENADSVTLAKIPAFWPSAFASEQYEEPPFVDDPNRTNNAFNVQDFGEQGKNGWFYRYGDSQKPHRSKQITQFSDGKYFQPGANGLEIKQTFVHTSQEAAPIYEWRVAQDGAVNVAVTYVKNVNGDKNPSYPDGVQIMVYQGENLLKLENVDISTTTENLAQIFVDDLPVTKGESLYFAVDPRANNAFDGGSLYINISDVNAAVPAMASASGRRDNNANSQTDFGAQGSNGWLYLYGTQPDNCKPVSHENNGEYINATSPNLSISQGFIHPAINDNAVLGWVPAVNGNVDLRIKYTKFEQHDGNPDFPDGVKVKVYKNNELLYEQHVDAPAEGENKIKFRIPKLAVTTSDMLYFMVDAEGNASYDGGAFDVTVIDIRGAEDESDVSVDLPETRQNFADVNADFGEQGSNGWIFQSGYEDDPFHAYNMTSFDQKEDRYFESSYLEIKRDYVNPGEHGRSAVIKWRVAQNGKVKIDASYTKLKNEDANPAWPDGTRVSLYYNDTLLSQQTFAPEVSKEVTKRLDVSSLSVSRGDYITMVINGLDNIAYDGGKYQFVISSLSGLVGDTEDDVNATYDGKRVNFASTMDDFGKQGYNGWYYQYGYYDDPFFAVNVERSENGEKYLTSDGIEIKKDYIVPANKGRSANVKWIVAENGRINIDLEYTKLKNEDANPSWPDGVTVYLMHDNTVLSKEYFAPLTGREVTKSLSVDNVKVSKGDAITMIVDPGENSAYDGGKYMFVIEDANKTPKVKVGSYDNSTSLVELPSVEQGTDGWWFLEGTSPADAKVLTKLNSEGTGYASRRTEGLEMQTGFVHTGATRDPIYQWVVGKNGKIDVAGEYMKFGQEDTNPDWPDGVTVKVWLNSKVLGSKKVNVLRGDGNNNVISFAFDALQVKRGDKLSFQICADDNFAWDGGKLSVAIDPTASPNLKPGKDNNTSLRALSDQRKQGEDGWYFMEGTKPANAKLLTRLNDDKSAYLSRKTDALEMKKDYVHPGATQDPIYLWVAAKNGKVDISGAYTKFGQNADNANYPDGVSVKIWLNNKALATKKVKALRGDGNDNVYSFSFDALSVKRGDKLSFQICSDKNFAWDAGRLDVAIEETNETKLVPGDDNNTALSALEGLKQGTDGWYFMEGTKPANAKLLTQQTEDKQGYVSLKTSGLEMRKDYVHTGETQDPIYQWMVAEDGQVDVAGTYLKFGHQDPNPDWPDGVTVKIWQNDKQLKSIKVNVLQGDGNNNVIAFNFDKLNVKRGDKLSFQICADKNNAWDGGRLSVAIEKTTTLNRTPGDDNNSVLADIPSMEQGTDGWWFMEGTKLDNVKPLTNLDGDAYKSTKDDSLEMKKDYVHPGAVQHPIYQWVVKDDGKLDVKGSYVKFGHNDGNPDWPDGITFTIYQNNDQLFKKQVKALKGDGNDNTATFDFKDLTVKAGDIFSFEIDPGDNNAWDAGRLNVTIGKEPEIAEVEPDPNRTNNANLANDFTDKQGNNGWYYGSCDWDSKNFTKIPYDADNERYFNNSKPELKKDFVEPGNGRNAAYKWVVAEDGTIKVSGEYVKFANADDSSANGVSVRIFLNGTEKKWMGNHVQGNFSEERKETFEETYEVKKGDELIFAINPEGNDSYDGGRLSVTIEPVQSEEPEEQRTNNTVLANDFSDTQGKNGWYYGACDWDSKNFTTIAYDADNERYFNNSKPELKKDFVEPGNGRNAAYKWVVAEDGTIKVSGEYVKFANADDSSANGVSVRIFLNGTEKKWMGNHVQGNFSEERKETFEETYEVKKGDELIFAINPEGNDSYDGGRLSVTIEPVQSEEPEEQRTNNTVLANDFSDTQGKNGWYYGACDWDSKNFTTIAYDADNERYFNNSKPELKKDFVEPGNGRNAAYKWVVAEDGTIKVSGEYVKFANADDSNADGVSVRIFLNGTEKKWMGNNVQGNFSEERKETFEETYEVKKGDELIFAINPEGNDSYDGGRLSVTIEPVQSEEPEEQRTNNAVLANDFSDTQGKNGWYYGACDWDSKNFTKIPYDADNERYFNNSKPALKKDFVEPGNGRNAAYKWVVAEDGTIKVSGEYVKFANADDSSADGVSVRIFLNGTEKKWMGNNVQGNFSEERKETFEETYEVKKGDELIFAINPEGNDSYDGGRLSVTIEPVQSEEPEEQRTNNTVLANDFSDTQGKNGWYYGVCDWDSKNFATIAYDADNERYFNNSKPELKKDFVEPGNGRNAAYKWVVAEDGTIKVSGEYVKFANADDSSANGVSVRIFLNGTEKKWMGNHVQGNFSEERKETFEETYEVKKGDELIFAINPEGNDSYDGGRLSVTIEPVQSEEPEEQRTNNTVLANDFSDTQGKNGWYYGACDWDSKNFATIAYDADNERYFNNSKPELKKDFVEPGNDRNAAYKWVVAEDGTIKVSGEYVKFANADDSSANGVSVRIFLNGTEKKWMGSNVQGNFSEERKETFEETYEVKKGDELIFAINPEGNDSYDGGRLSVTIAPTTNKLLSAVKKTAAKAVAALAKVVAPASTPAKTAAKPAQAVPASETVSTTARETSEPKTDTVGAQQISDTQEQTETAAAEEGKAAEVEQISDAILPEQKDVEPEQPETEDSKEKTMEESEKEPEEHSVQAESDETAPAEENENTEEG